MLLASGLGLLYEAWRFPSVGELATGTPGRTSLIEHRVAEAKKRGVPYRVVQHQVPLAAVAPALREAVLISEDDRFYAHDGFDTEEMKEALEDRFQKGLKLRGASTLSQQLARTLWLTPERSWVRKLREAAYTFALERRLSKDRILELYLNLAEWGPGIFGAEAAAQHYFGVTAATVSPHQAALLAAALPNPLKRNPGHPTAYLERRARHILDRLGEAPVVPRTATATPGVAAARPAATAAPRVAATATATPAPAAKPAKTAKPARPAVTAVLLPTRAPTPADLLLATPR